MNGNSKGGFPCVFLSSIAVFLLVEEKGAFIGGEAWANASSILWEPRLLSREFIYSLIPGSMAFLCVYVVVWKVVQFLGSLVNQNFWEDKHKIHK